MKKHINLFQQKERTDFFTKLANRIRGVISIVGITLFLLFCLLVAQSIRLSQAQKDLLKKKEQYLRYLLTEKDSEANMRYFKSKETQMNTFLKDDARFLPYYKILKDALDATSTSTTLETIEIDKTRSTRFIVKFADYDQMLLFLKKVESTDFLSNFTSLSLQSFSLSAKKGKTDNFQLELKGVFKEIKI